MNIKNIVFIICMSINLALVAQQPSQNKRERFLQAYELYQKNQNQEALMLLDSFTNKSSLVWYNMGNCSYRLGDYLKALLYFKRAERQAVAQEHADIVHNMRMAQRALGFAEESFGVYQRMVVWLRMIPLLLLQLLFLLLWVCLLGLFFFGVRLGKLKTIVMIIIAFSALIIAWASWVKYRDETAIYALVMKDANLFVGPNSAYHVVVPVALGSTVKVDEIRNEWYKVHTKEKKGWLQAEDVEQF